MSCREELTSPQTEIKANVGFEAGFKDYKLNGVKASVKDTRNT